MNDSKEQLPSEVEQMIMEEIRNIIANKTLAGALPYNFIDEDGVTQISIIVATRQLGDKIGEFIEEEFRNSEGVDFERQDG